MAFESVFAVSERVVLVLSPLGSYLQDGNQLSSPLTLCSRHEQKFFSHIDVDWRPGHVLTPPPSTGGYISIRHGVNPYSGGSLRHVSMCLDFLNLVLPN